MLKNKMDRLKEEIGLLKLMFGLVFIPWISLLGWLSGQVVHIPLKIDLETMSLILDIIWSFEVVLLVVFGMSIFLLVCLLEIRRKIDEL